jgi:hypothetical protein
MTEKPTNRWKCPMCSSTDVQVSYPMWFYETKDFHLTHIEVDEGSGVLWWFCRTCEESDTGSPDANT